MRGSDRNITEDDKFARDAEELDSDTTDVGGKCRRLDERVHKDPFKIILSSCYWKGKPLGGFRTLKIPSPATAYQ